MNIILASKSPRRRELLPKMGIRDFVIEESGVDEDKITESLTDPRDIVKELAAAKARYIAEKHGFDPETVVIGSDTVVSFEGKILGKPADPDEARRMLRMLSGREHQVYSGVSVIKGKRELVDFECTDVRFRQLSDRDIESYIAAEPPLDKAGAYGIQGLACLFVSGIVGDFYNVMGLPLFKLGRILNEAGVELL